MITLKNKDLTVTVNELGAELKSVRCDGMEYLWNGDPAFWSGTAPMLFPICGTLKEDRFTYQGKEIHMGGKWARLTMKEAVKQYSGIDYDSWAYDEAARAELKAKGTI